MSWVKLDDQFPDHPKVLAAGPAAAWVYVAGLCYASRHLTDGAIPLRVLRHLGGTKQQAKRLVDAGLWEEADDGYRVHDYLEYQPSRNEVTQRRSEISQERSKAGSKGAAKRWQTDSPSPAPPVPLPDPDPDPIAAEQLAKRQRVKTTWTNRCGFLPNSYLDEFYGFVDYTPEEWFTQAIEITVTEADHPNWKFCKAVLERAHAENAPPQGSNEFTEPMTLASVLARRPRRSARR